jgi:glycogen synthase
VHVLQIAWEYPPRLFGGLGRHVEGLVDALAVAGADVTVLTPDCEGPETAPDGVRVIRAAAPPEPLPAADWLAGALDANVAMAQAALDVLPASDVDVIHAHDWMAGHATRILARVLGVPVVLTVHATEQGRHMGYLPPGPSAWIAAQERTLAALADEVLVCSDHMAVEAARHLGVPADRCTTVPNGIDVDAWRAPPTARTAGSAEGPVPRIVFAGRLEHEKGVHVLLEATADISCEVVIAGEGTQGSRLRDAAHDRVRFTGHLDRSELAALLRTASVVAVPSLYEPFGLAALEAMAVGAPVVVSDVGGLAEVVVDGSGLRVRPDDPRHLATALRRVLTDPAFARRLQAGGTARARELTWTAAAGATAEVYARLSSSRPTGASHRPADRRRGPAPPR